jgi:putative DNA base modification enzyme with NMAD domain
MATNRVCPMKIILSRKGFDASTGKRPSFITQNGDLVSLPIPDRPNAAHSTTYQKITTAIGTLDTILPSIKARILGHNLAHLDPDLCQSSITRNGTWVGAFGPRTRGGVNIPIQHNVGPGDLFLFFGWFKEQSTTYPNPPYKRGAPHLHVVFGYLQVDAVYQNHQISQLLHKYPGLSNHPHVCTPRNAAANNRIFVASQTLSLPGVSSRPGWGLFNYDPKLVLTRKKKNGVWEPRGHWLLRNLATNSNQQPPFIRNAGVFRNWRQVGYDWEVTDFGRGQEFLIDTCNFPGALSWARTFF